MKKERDINIDIICLVASILVIAVHIANYYCWGFWKINRFEYVFSMIINVISRICAPCFFMVIGAIFLGKEDSLKKSAKRVLHYGAAVVFWTVLYYFFNTEYLGAFIDLKKILEVPAESHLWYMYMIIPIFIVMPFLQVICKNMKKEHEIWVLVLGCVAMAFTYLPLGDHGQIALFGRYPYSVLCMFVGHLFRKYKDSINIRNVWLILIFLATVIFNTAICLYGSFNENTYFSKTLAFSNPLVLIGSASIVLFLLRVKVRDNRGVSAVASCSLGIYFLHYIFVEIFAKVWGVVTFPAYVAIPLFLVIVFVVCLIPVYLIKKIPVVRKLV